MKKIILILLLFIASNIYAEHSLHDVEISSITGNRLEATDHLILPDGTDLTGSTSLVDTLVRISTGALAVKVSADTNTLQGLVDATELATATVYNALATSTGTQLNYIVGISSWISGDILTSTGTLLTKSSATATYAQINGEPIIDGLLGINSFYFTHDGNTVYLTSNPFVYGGGGGGGVTIATFSYTFNLGTVYLANSGYPRMQDAIWTAESDIDIFSLDLWTSYTSTIGWTGLNVYTSSSAGSQYMQYLFSTHVAQAGITSATKSTITVQSDTFLPVFTLDDGGIGHVHKGHWIGVEVSSIPTSGEMPNIWGRIKYTRNLSQ